MLVELHVRDLGVIEEAAIELGPGLTALTGETGAGKTLLVDALEIVLGGRARRGLVQPGQTARLEAIFELPDGTETIIAREIPSDGRARTWIDGRLATVQVLQDHVGGLLDIHGQHEHHSLLVAGSMRAALDAFGDVDASDVARLRRELADVDAAQLALGGDLEAIEREVALLDHQVAEIDAAELDDPAELELLLGELEVLSNIETTARALVQGIAALGDDATPSIHDELARLRSALDPLAALGEVVEAITEADAVLDDLRSLLRRTLDGLEDDPARRDAIDLRLRVLHDLVRRYGPTLSDVLERRGSMADEAARLRSSLEVAGTTQERRAALRRDLADAEAILAETRHACVPALEEALHARLATLALARATVEVTVAGPGGDDVDLLFSANKGHQVQPVARAASGGELARLMLALRLVLPGGPSTMVFDEVDAGIGGATAVVLAQALREVAVERQVLVVTHLAQVAAAADRQISVVKSEGDRDTATAVLLDDEERTTEIARMLAGHASSSTARRHAAELLGGNGSAATLPGVV
jgi:DNA repair protein RecN (Recombination protein N)